LLRLLALLTLAKLLELRFARLGNLAIDVLAALRLHRSRGTCEEGGQENECCHFHTLPLPTVVIGYSSRQKAEPTFAFTIFI
jgi:hypothetical protein